MMKVEQIAPSSLGVHFPAGTGGFMGCWWCHCEPTLGFHLEQGKHPLGKPRKSFPPTGGKPVQV